MEVTEADEEPVIEKVARVKEEVVVRKDAKERTETVRDTVRREDVQIDNARETCPGAHNPALDRTDAASPGNRP